MAGAVLKLYCGNTRRSSAVVTEPKRGETVKTSSRPPVWVAAWFKTSRGAMNSVLYTPS